MKQHRGRGWAGRALVGIPLAVLLTLAATGVLVPPAASASVVVNGSDWFGGGGVPVCYSSSSSCPGVTPVGGVSGAPWQCVELAQRFYQAKGWYSGIFSGVWYAYQIFSWAPGHGMDAHPNGSGYVPVPGDMIIHNSSVGGGAGHVSIVDTVQGGTVNVVEQNASPTGRATYSLSGSTLSRSGLSGIIGVVHDPDNQSHPPPPPIDTDGDGTPNATDQCPSVPGPGSNGGCPLELDVNGDGRADLLWYDRSGPGGAYRLNVIGGTSGGRFGAFQQVHDGLGVPAWGGGGSFSDSNGGGKPRYPT